MMVPMGRETTIAIAATFTAEPLEPPLAYWMRELRWEARIRFAPYDQVFQQLLDPASLLLTNEDGLNVVLLKPDDWIRSRDENDIRINLPQNELERKARDFLTAVRSAASRSKVPHLAMMCPVSPAVGENSELATIFRNLEQTLLSDLRQTPDIHGVSSSELQTTYPVARWFDAMLDREAHIPFTPASYAALATMITRRLYAVTNRPYKVIVLDCDHTLWDGICGEDRLEDVKIDGPYRALQQFMLAQHDAGMLLCLSSRNNELDVWRVFDRHPDMVLKREHIVSWRLNWMHKSQNLKSLANELNVGLDSFIFVDDNPIECAEVRAELPEVLTVQLPAEARAIPTFLRHVWAFDHLKITGEDRQRAAFYVQNAARLQFEKESPTFREFLAGLHLDVRIQPMSPDEIPRVAQLMNRTNQFNCTAVRRCESEVQRIYSSGELECLVVRVKDRFGDYGLVGIMMFDTTPDAVELDAFLLSCRVLGRRVEHRMLRELGRIARQRNIPCVNIRFRPTGRNQPALEFLNGLELGSGQPDGEDLVFGFPTESAMGVMLDPEVAFEERPISTPPRLIEAADVPRNQAQSHLLCRIAAELHSIELVLKDMPAKKPHVVRAEAMQDHIAPRTPTEKALCEIWKELLGMPGVGVRHNFFDMGGHSLLATQVLSRIYGVLGLELSIQDIFEAPTVEELASVVETRQIEQAEPEQILEVLKDIDGLTDDQVEASLLREGQSQ